MRAFIKSPSIFSALKTKRHHHGCRLVVGDETALLWHRRKSLWSMVFFLFYERVPQGLRILYPRVILDNTKSILLFRSTNYIDVVQNINNAVDQSVYMSCFVVLAIAVEFIRKVSIESSTCTVHEQGLVLCYTCTCTCKTTN